KERERKWASFATRIMICVAIGALLVSATPFSVRTGADTVPTTGGPTYPPTVPIVGPDSGVNPTDSIFYTLFSDAMAQNSVEEAFTIEPTVTGTFNWTDDREMAFEPDSPLSENTTYTARINASIAYSSYGYYLDGNANGIEEGSPIDDVVWSFMAGPPEELPEPPQDLQPWAQFLKIHQKTGHYVGDVTMGPTSYFEQTDTRVDSSPVVGSGIVVFGDNGGTIYGLKESDLTSAWNPISVGSSRIRTVALDKEENPVHFYVATEGSSNEKPVVQKRYLNSGGIVKSLKLRGKEARIYSPLTYAPGGTGEVTNDRVYFLAKEVKRGTLYTHLFGYSANLRKRELKFTLEEKHVMDAGVALANSASNPSIRRLVFGIVEREVYSVPEWPKNPKTANMQPVGGGVYTTPSVDGTDVYVTDFSGGSPCACKLYKGPADLDSELVGFGKFVQNCYGISSPINDESNVYISYRYHPQEANWYSGIVAYDKVFGSRIWLFERLVDENIDFDSEIVSSPAVAHDFVFHIVNAEKNKPGIGTSGTIYQLWKSSGTWSYQHDLPSNNYFTLSSVALHQWGYYRVFAMQKAEPPWGDPGAVEVTNEP
ncbi:MAG: Ig-like domain-containing protein, partial [Thermoplasmata archaeon]